MSPASESEIWEAFLRARLSLENDDLSQRGKLISVGFALVRLKASDFTNRDDAMDFSVLDDMLQRGHEPKRDEGTIEATVFKLSETEVEHALALARQLADRYADPPRT